jgi:site-specific recombinase XerD
MRNLPFEQLHEITLKEVYQKATAENSDLRKDIRLKTLRHHFGIEQIKKMDSRAKALGPAAGREWDCMKKTPENFYYWHKKYTPRGIQKMFKKYVTVANISVTLTPHKMRHYLFRWLKSHGIDDALIQPYSGHESRQSLEIYSRLSIQEAQAAYDDKIKKFPL